MILLCRLVTNKVLASKCFSIHKTHFLSSSLSLSLSLSLLQKTHKFLVSSKEFSSQQQQSRDAMVSDLISLFNSLFVSRQILNLFIMKTTQQTCPKKFGILSLILFIRHQQMFLPLHQQYYLGYDLDTLELELHACPLWFVWLGVKQGGQKIRERKLILWVWKSGKRQNMG